LQRSAVGGEVVRRRWSKLRGPGAGHSSELRIPSKRCGDVLRRCGGGQASRGATGGEKLHGGRNFSPAAEKGRRTRRGRRRAPRGFWIRWPDAAASGGAGELGSAAGVARAVGKLRRRSTSARRGDGSGAALGFEGGREVGMRRFRGAAAVKKGRPGDLGAWARDGRPAVIAARDLGAVARARGMRGRRACQAGPDGQ